jgi:acrylyl-CoA reductase (NADPH)
MFDAVLLEEIEGQPRARLAQLDDEELPEGSVSIDVSHSALNYKDALAITGTTPIARRYPMVPGVDLAGTVSASDHPDYSAGDEVVATGFGIGEQHWGGLSQRARLDGDWIVPLPPELTTRQAMAIGTAGLTAALCVWALEDRGAQGDILVTGAGGGVGGLAIALLSQRGHHVVASTGRTEEADYLHRLGARDIIDRAELSSPGKLLEKQRWGGAVDTVGGDTLASVCASIRYGGTVAACGNAGGMKVPTSVAPFILRAVTLVGIDSVQTPVDRRVKAWQRLVADLEPEIIDTMTNEIGLSETPDTAPRLLAGQVRGRMVVDTSR